jgi:hypothetical protein
MTPSQAYNIARLKSIPGTAAFSADQKYRYLLTRSWGSNDRAINFLMCNPSVADAKILDRTVAKCLYWAILWGYDTLLITNVFAYRSTNPRNLALVEDPIGIPTNHTYISEAMEWATNSGGLVVCGWGNHGASQDLTMRSLAAKLSINLWCMALNHNQVPKHPLYISKAATPRTFDLACRYEESDSDVLEEQ